MIIKEILVASNNCEYLKITRFAEKTLIIFETQADLIRYIINTLSLNTHIYPEDNFREICENVTEDNIHVYDEAVAIYQ